METAPVAAVKVTEAELSKILPTETELGDRQIFPLHPTAINSSKVFLEFKRPPVTNLFANAGLASVPSINACKTMSAPAWGFAITVFIKSVQGIE